MPLRRYGAIVGSALVEMDEVAPLARSGTGSSNRPGPRLPAATIAAPRPRLLQAAAHGAVQIETAEQAAEVLRPLAGDLAGLLFAAGIVGTGLLAVPVLAGSTAYAIAEAAGWHEGLGRRVGQARAFYAVIAASMPLGVAMDLIGVGAIRALYLSAILNDMAAPPLLVLIVLLARSVAVLGRHRSGLLSQLLVGVAALVMASLVGAGGTPLSVRDTSGAALGGTGSPFTPSQPGSWPELPVGPSRSPGASVRAGPAARSGRPG